jgi:hypothetical protein
MSSNDSVQSRLLSFYWRLFGEPESESDVYLGFALFFGGITFGLLGLVIFLGSSIASIEQGTDFFWQTREIAIVLAMLGLPSFILSFVVLLPVDQRARYASGFGVAICLLAAAVFVWAYPSTWNVDGTDYSREGITIYAAGLAVLVASSGAGLVGQRLKDAETVKEIREVREIREEVPVERDAGGDGSADTGEDVSEEQVRRDIDEAMNETNLNWGGVERNETRQLQIEMDDGDIDSSSFDDLSANESRSSVTGVDEAVSGLQNMQTQEKDTATGDDVDEQTAALQELRNQQRGQDIGGTETDEDAKEAESKTREVVEESRTVTEVDRTEESEEVADAEESEEVADAEESEEGGE